MGHMFVKRNLTRRQPTEAEVENLSYPKDKFDLIKVNYVDEWDLCKLATSTDDPRTKSYVYRKKSVHITVKCKKCGTVKNDAADSPNLSCKTGPCMSTWVDLTGRRFGNLVVEGLDLTRVQKGQRQRRWYWKCRCDCGNYCYKTGADLVTHYHRMCPSCARKQAIRKTTLPDSLSKWHRMIRIYKKNAVQNGREFSLTDEQFVAITKGNCVYCGNPPVKGSYGVVCNGIDRVDASKGYTLENSVPCCHRCNYMKNKLTTGQFLDHVRRIYEHSILGSKLNDHPEREYASSEAEKGTDL